VSDFEYKQTPWGPTGQITFTRTYAREVKGVKESYPETIERIIEACDKQLKCGFTPREEDKLRLYFSQLKGSVAGRFWWQLGTPTVRRLGLASLQNCAATVVDDPIRPFTWAMDMLMLGSGVGYNIQREYVNELPKARRAKIVRQDDAGADFIVPDSREGWVKLLGRVLKAHFLSGKGFTYSTHCVRGKGAAIKGFGGVASGPEELCWGMEQISNVLNSRAGKKVRPIDCLDIMNIIGYIVVAGNVRRSAQVAIGDADDIEFLNAKRWDLGNIPNWRAMSNNSVASGDTTTLPEEFWEGYLGNGEAYGLINLPLSRRVGRLGDTMYPDPDVTCYNPCCEQGLGSYETCCLAEIFLPNIESVSEMMDVCRLLYRINKHSLALKCHHPETQEIVNRQMRMGIGITGVMQATEKQKEWLAPCYDYLRAFDKEYSYEHKWPESIKLTTVKPSGTLSLLAGVTPGCHPGYSRFFIRRIRIASSSELVGRCRDSGYHCEPVRNLDGTEDHNTTVVEFPCRYPDNAVLASDVTAVQQLENVKWLQTVWSDNSVSCTVYYKKEELPEIKQWLAENFTDGVKTCSFLLHSDHGFAQAPYEEITKEKYEELVAKTTPITDVNISEDDFELEECSAGGACPVK
jgi:ribonucleoside-triphosphate reductase